MRSTAGIVLAAALSIAMSGCAGPSALDAPDGGRTDAYEPGVPNFDIESVVRVDDDRASVEVYYSFPYASLVFVQSDERFEAEYEMTVRLIERMTERVEAERSAGRRISVTSYDSTLGFHPHSGQISLHVPTGEYVVRAVMTDVETRESTERRQSVRVVAAGSGDAHLGRILLEGTGSSGRTEPVVSRHMPARMDSLFASIDLYNMRDGSDIDVTMSLVRYETDSTFAAPPYWFIPSRASIAYRGVDWTTSDTIQISRRSLDGAGERASVQFLLPSLERGVYRLRIEGRDSSRALELRRERVLSVKNETFPRISMLDDLIESLAYIAYDNEIDHIREGDTPGERKRRFDAFWGSLVTNRNLAGNLVELYYSRIEEANLFFTGYKEGWMTDRGMIFTVLGPPAYIDRRMDLEIWHYSYGDRDPVNTFVFEQAREGRDGPFDTYILQRKPYYQNAWARAIDRWRDGTIL